MDNFEAKAQLTTQELALLESEMRAKEKNMILAYLLWFFLGTFGVHNFYAGNSKSGIGKLILLVASIILSFVLIGVFGFVILGIWVLVDAFLLYRWINDHNAELEQTIAGQILARRTAAG